MLTPPSLKTFAFLILSGLLWLSSPTQARAQSVMRIAAVVNDDVISAQDLAQRIKLTIATTRMPNTPEVRRRLASQILRNMIDERLKSQEAEKKGIEVTEEQIKTGLEGYARSVNIKVELFDQFLARLNIDPVIIEDQAQAEIAWSMVLTQTSGDRIRVTDKEIDDTLAEIKDNQGKPEYLFSEIYLPIDTPDQEAAAKQMAERLINHIQSGSPFAALARDFSQSPSAKDGGDVGWVQSGSLDKSVEQVLAQLPEGGFSQPIKTPSGYYILNLRQKRISGQQESEEQVNIAQILLPLGANPAPELIQTHQATLQNIAAQANSCEDMVNLGKQTEGANASKFDNIKLSQMPPLVRQAITPLGKGQKTIINQQNKALLALMICDRFKAEPVPEIAKRQALKRKLRMEKIVLEGRRRIQLLRRNAFVDIRL